MNINTDFVTKLLFQMPAVRLRSDMNTEQKKSITVSQTEEEREGRDRERQTETDRQTDRSCKGYETVNKEHLLL